MASKAATPERKLDHIRVVANQAIQARTVTSGFEDIHLIHKSLPEIKLEDISLEAEFFNHKLSAPIIISSMTGGTREALKINATLAEVAEKLGLAMGLGSQRSAIEHPELAETYSIARQKAPSTFLMANLGGAQLIKGYGVKEAQMAVEMIKADALIIHLNALQECVQPEGDPNYEGVLEAIHRLTRTMKLPIIAKETGAGISREDAVKLEAAGVDGIDVAGAGGTSWSAVESYRTRKPQDDFHQNIAHTFWDWGIPTAASLIEVRNAIPIVTIGSGGIRNGVDIAKAFALGADAVALAYPLFKASLNGVSELEALLRGMMNEVKTVMFLTGARNISEMRKVPVVITGRTAEWLRMRGVNPAAYARRKGIEKHVKLHA